MSITASQAYLQCVLCSSVMDQYNIGTPAMLQSRKGIGD